MASRNKKTAKKPFANFSWFYLILILGIFYLLFSNRGYNIREVQWPEVKQMLQEGDVKQVNFVRNDFTGTVTLRQDSFMKYMDKFGGVAPDRSPHFEFMVSSKFDPEATFEEINTSLQPDRQFKVVMENNNTNWGDIIQWIIFGGFFIAMWAMMFRGVGRNLGGGKGGPGGIFNVGRSTGKLADKNTVNVTFKDVAGLYGAKEEVMEIVDFLKNPKKYTSLGAKIPKGALLVGPPGTGKTLLAKAVAGEANVPFFSISGSDFVEMFVGVGASRVRDLFAQAKEKAPCIVFIDEIDAVGRARGKNAGFSSNDERENTLNQLLTEMDGFASNSGVIILAATNRADILDKALMRAGRFDRQINVELPELKERIEIFNVHLKNIKLDPSFDVEVMAKHTPGFSGADIANVCNEAALTAARRNKKLVSQEDFMEAVDRIIGGLERKSSTIMTPAEKRTTAYHEAGHAVVGWLLPHADPVFKVSLIPRGKALGLTWSLPSERKILSKSFMMDEMCTLMGGRVAEELINNEPASGALSDLERLTTMAYAMVQYYGMSSKVGALSFYDSTGARGYELVKPYSEKTAELMDQEVRNLVDEVHARTEKIIKDNYDAFEKVAKLLLDKEVIMQDDLEAILGPKVTDKEPEAEVEAEPKPTETENE
ncbi:MAG: ATP-dependent zinc metalloprotease FtsH [Bacteroidales bacterium]|nr:ATP-dependent zinc metalloprotease FtsH [Bacteroidales bacterium]MBQ8460803.1 ATP-dependent zinc metalloprotease FtsH [Bacteroidales bacterium]MDT3360383.1 ATP-dependent zinc metalloprotease FtsH [Bacteroidota bacterium]